MESGGTRVIGDFIHDVVPQKHGLCISDFSVAGTKYSDKINLRKQGFIMTYSSRGIESIMEGRHSRRSETSCHACHIFNPHTGSHGGWGRL